MKSLRRFQQFQGHLHSIGTKIPKELLERFNLCVKIEGKTKRRVFGELVLEYCDRVLPENYAELKNIIDRHG